MSPSRAPAESSEVLMEVGVDMVGDFIEIVSDPSAYPSLPIRVKDNRRVAHGIEKKFH